MNYKTVFFFCIVISSISAASATTIRFDEAYTDYLGNAYIYNSENIALHPYYTVTSDANTYTISRQGEDITLPKRTWITYNFYPDRIQPVITIQNFAQINQLVTKVNPTSWYLTTPFTASQVRYTTDNYIEMGKFKRTLDLDIKDSNGVNFDAYTQVIGGDIRIYFNPTTYGSVVWPLTITENTVIVNNSSTSGWDTGIVIMNGSRWTDSGLLAINLNASYLTNLVGYWSLDETSGTIVHNINNESGTINLTNLGTWNGNTSINYTDGRIGKATNFDGTDDLINIGVVPEQNFTIGFWANPLIIETGTSGIIGTTGYATKKGTGLYSNANNLYSFWIGNNSVNKIISNIFTISLGYNYYTITKSNETFRAYKNGIVVFEDSTTIPAGFVMYTTGLSFNIGESISSVFNFNGSIDEVKLWNKSLSSSEISEEYNRSMRLIGMPLILNQISGAGSLINSSSVTFMGGDAFHNISLYGRQNGTSTWSLIQSNVVSGVAYTHPSSVQFNAMDFSIQMNGNGSNTTFIESLTWNEHIPTLTITSLINTTGNFFVNHSWTNGDATDYNVSINGTWYNGTTNLYNYTISYPHGWVNISVAGHIDGITGTLVSQNTQVPNNLPSCNVLITPRTVITDAYLNFTLSCTDADGDPITLSTNATLGTFNITSGFYTYRGTDADKGTYEFLFSAVDNYSGYRNQTIVVTVSSTLDIINARFDTLDAEVSNAGALGFIGGIMGGVLAMVAINKCCKRRRRRDE